MIQILLLLFCNSLNLQEASRRLHGDPVKGVACSVPKVSTANFDKWPERIGSSCGNFNVSYGWCRPTRKIFNCPSGEKATARFDVRFVFGHRTMHWKITQVRPFYGCCITDSWANVGTHQLYNNQKTGPTCVIFHCLHRTNSIQVKRSNEKLLENIGIWKMNDLDEAWMQVRKVQRMEWLFKQSFYAQGGIVAQIVNGCQGPYLNDVRKILRVFAPLLACHWHTQATYQCSCLPLGYPLPPPTVDVI